MLAAIRAVEHYLPEIVVTNDELAARSDRWTAEAIAEKTGVVERRIARADQCATDLAAEAVDRLFASGACSRRDIDYLLLCTQSPDYFLPSSACTLQHRLGLGTSIGAVDINLGCSGFVSGLSLAKALIETRQATNVLLVTSDTYSKFLQQDDLSVRTLFGDGAAATLVQGVPEDSTRLPFIGPFHFGTDGAGAEHLIVREGGMRARSRKSLGQTTNDHEPLQPTSDVPFPLSMNGPAVFTFAAKRVPELVRELLRRSTLAIADVRWFVFHQANQYVLEHLRKKIEIPAERFLISMSHCGNTVSSTIPIALQSRIDRGELAHGDRLMLVGFGVGLSWTGSLVRWHG
jgi:3-oxoacyl-[acyl-carrier-protein] synthase III